MSAYIDENGKFDCDGGCLSCKDIYECEYTTISKKPVNNYLMNNTDELKKLIQLYPDLPICVLVNGEVVQDDSQWWYCASVKFTVGEILTCESPVNPEKVYYDEDDFREDMEEMIADNYEKYFTGYDCASDIPDDVFDERVNEELKKYEPYWEKVINVWCDN